MASASNAQAINSHVYEPRQLAAPLLGGAHEKRIRVSGTSQLQTALELLRDRPAGSNAAVLYKSTALLLSELFAVGSAPERRHRDGRHDGTRLVVYEHDVGHDDAPERGQQLTALQQLDDVTEGAHTVSITAAHAMWSYDALDKAIRSEACVVFCIVPAEDYKLQKCSHALGECPLWLLHSWQACLHLTATEGATAQTTAATTHDFVLLRDGDVDFFEGYKALADLKTRHRLCFVGGEVQASALCGMSARCYDDDDDTDSESAPEEQASRATAMQSSQGGHSRSFFIPTFSE